MSKCEEKFKENIHWSVVVPLRQVCVSREAGRAFRGMKIEGDRPLATMRYETARYRVSQIVVRRMIESVLRGNIC
jgi:hypothetical protein